MIATKQRRTQVAKRVQARNFRGANYLSQKANQGYERVLTDRTAFATPADPIKDPITSVAAGTPLEELQLPNGVVMDDTTEIIIDASQVSAANPIEFILFDQGGYYGKKFAKSNTVTPIIGTATENYYEEYVEGLCSSTYFYTAIMIQAEVSPNANIEAKTQLNTPLKFHTISTNGETATVKTLRTSAFLEPGNFDKEVRTVQLPGKMMRVDRHDAIVGQVYPGVLLRMTFVKIAKQTGW